MVKSSSKSVRYQSGAFALFSQHNVHVCIIQIVYECNIMPCYAARTVWYRHVVELFLYAAFWQYSIMTWCFVPFPYFACRLTGVEWQRHVSTRLWSAVLLCLKVLSLLIISLLQARPGVWSVIAKSVFPMQIIPYILLQMKRNSCRFFFFAKIGIRTQN